MPTFLPLGHTCLFLFFFFFKFMGICWWDKVKMKYFQAKKGQDRETESAEASWAESRDLIINHKADVCPGTQCHSSEAREEILKSDEKGQTQAKENVHCRICTECNWVSDIYVAAIIRLCLAGYRLVSLGGWLHLMYKKKDRKSLFAFFFFWSIGSRYHGLAGFPHVKFKAYLTTTKEGRDLYK